MIEDRKTLSFHPPSSILDLGHVSEVEATDQINDLIAARLNRPACAGCSAIPSGPVLPLIEALREARSDFVLTASETSAAFHGFGGRLFDRRSRRLCFDGGSRRDQSHHRRRLRLVGPRAGARDHLQCRHALARAAHSDAHRSSQAVRAADQGDCSLAAMADVGETVRSGIGRSRRKNRRGRCISICPRMSRRPRRGAAYAPRRRRFSPGSFRTKLAETISAGAAAARSDRCSLPVSPSRAARRRRHCFNSSSDKIFPSSRRSTAKAFCRKAIRTRPASSAGRGAAMSRDSPTRPI